ncbi:MAG: right-handed parallel beta-helix repeat-containing protein [Pyrinomonadaceae bacterium]
MFKIGAVTAAVVIPGIAALFYFAAPHFPDFSSQVVSSDRIVVRAGQDLQKALDSAKPGDTILVQAGASFKGNFKLRKKRGTGVITIRSSASDDQLPKEGERIDPTVYAPVLPKLSSPNSEAVVSTEAGAHGFRFVGVEFQSTKGGFSNIIQIGTSEEETVADIPTDIEFDRVYIHATDPAGQRRGIAANGRRILIRNSHISGIRRKGEESQAIAMWGADGPVEIRNNYLEAAAENILFGGASSTLKLVPTSCVVEGNTLNKPVSWRNEGWVVKNIFEIKNGKNIVVRNNVMTNNWVMGQEGTAILFTVREDNGPATIIEDILFENNVVRGTSSAVNVWGGEGGGGRNLTIRNNLFADVDHKKWGGRGFFLKASEWDGLKIENNTIINSGNVAIAYGKPIQNFVFANNIVFYNDYGISGDDTSPGQEAISVYFPGARIVHNAIIGARQGVAGNPNYYLSSSSQIGFADQKDFRLSPSSPYRSKGTNGRGIGYQPTQQ